MAMLFVYQIHLVLCVSAADDGGGGVMLKPWGLSSDGGNEYLDASIHHKLGTIVALASELAPLEAARSYSLGTLLSADALQRFAKDSVRNLLGPQYDVLPTHHCSYQEQYVRCQDAPDSLPLFFIQKDGQRITHATQYGQVAGRGVLEILIGLSRTNQEM